MENIEESQVKCEKIRKIQKKPKLNCENIGKYGRKIS
jgi:hypothetical protein